MPKSRRSAGRSPFADLSRREREIMAIIYRRGSATAAEVHDQMPDAPTATAVRTMLRILEEKGHLRHEKDGPRHVYLPTTAREAASRSAVRELLKTFFGGSAKAAVAALLDVSERDLTASERRQLIELIRASREQGK